MCRLEQGRVVERFVPLHYGGGGPQVGELTRLGGGGG